MKTLVSKYSRSYCSETIQQNGNKFKIVSKNDNSYSHLIIYSYTKNGDLEIIATEFDIPNYNFVDYIWSDDKRLDLSKKNIEAAKEYIFNVFGR